MVSAPSKDASSHVASLRRRPEFSWIQEELSWLCCVQCRCSPGSKDCGFYVTDCGHVYCSNCKVSRCSTCAQCGRSNMKFLEITVNIKDHSQVGHLFCDIPEACKRVTRLIEFQNMHKKRCRDHDRDQAMGTGHLDCNTLGDLANVSHSELQKRFVAEVKNTNVKEQNFKQLRNETQQALAEVEDLVIQLRGLGWRDIEILSIQGDGGGSANSTQALQETIRLLNSSKDMRHIQTLADNLRGAGSSVNTTVTRSGGPDQSLATPRAMSVRDTAVPHQFGLTPFSGHTATPSSVQRNYKMLPPPPPPPPLPHTLTPSHHSQPNVTGASPMSWQQHPGISPIGRQMCPPRMPPSRRAPTHGVVNMTPSPVNLQPHRLAPGLMCHSTPSPSHSITPVAQHSQSTNRVRTPSGVQSTTPSPYRTPNHIVGQVVRRGSSGGMDIIPGQSTSCSNVTPDQHTPRMKTTPSSGSKPGRVSVRARPTAGKLNEGGWSHQRCSPSPSMMSQRSNTPNSGRINIIEHRQRR